MIRWQKVSFVLTLLLAARNAAAVQMVQDQPVTTSVPIPTSSPPVQLATTEAPPPAPTPTAPTPAAATTSAVSEPPPVIRSGPSYGQRGVIELGGFFNFSGASSFASIQASPTAGYFLADNLELTGIIGVNYVHQTFVVNGDEISDHKTIVRVLAEPSYHLPLNPMMSAFLGIGMGVASVPVTADGSSLGFDLAPRVGANFLVGRSGLISPAFFIDFTTGQALQANGSTLLGVNMTYGLQAGYTVMF